jgi:4-amino-4-deoxy-L-arabinose transferase-like glycosyltransferase
LLFLALAIIGVALLLYLFTRDRRYLRFIWQIAKLTVVILVVVLLVFAVDRLRGPGATPLT